MKRKSGKSKRSKTFEESVVAEESKSVTSEEGKGSDDDSSLDSEPLVKKRKTKSKKESPQEIKTNTPKRKSSRGRKNRDSELEEENDDGSSSANEDSPEPTSPKKKSKGRKSKESVTEEENGNGRITEEDEGNKKTASIKGKARKEKKSKKESVEDEDTDLNNEDNEQNNEEEYEVESIVDEKTIRGVKYFLIRWKGYDENSDTWEAESTLACPEALQEFKKKKSQLKGSKPVKTVIKSKKTSEINENWNENEDFEVVRILDVHFRRDGKREFLVAWKGYSQKYDSWEPEENMNCKDLIERFLKKCDEAKEANPKELRVHRKITDRFTLSTNDTGRRLSKRNQGKQRIHYHDAE